MSSEGLIDRQPCAIHLATSTLVAVPLNESGAMITLDIGPRRLEGID